MSADLNCIFSTAQTVTGTDTTVQSTDWIDMKVAQDNAGGVAPVVEIIVSTTFAGGTSVQPQLCACEADGSNPVVIATLAPILIASLVAASGTPAMGGSRFLLKMSPLAALPAISGSDPRQALRMQYVLVGAVSAGALTAHITNEAGTSFPGKGYACGY